MARTEVHLKDTGAHIYAQPAEVIAVCQDREGLIILEADSYIIRARFTEQETRAIVLKFLPPIP